MSNRAWVTLATNDSYGLGALVLAHSLRRANSAHPAVVLITPSVTEAMRNRLSAVFAEVITVNVLDSQDSAHLALLQRPELGITFTKIHCWTLTQYEKCVFLDADTLIVQNCDELFDREELSAAPDVGWPDCFNSGVFVFVPSQETYSRLITFAQERGSFDGGDQGLLNAFFADWAHGDINKHLPFLYNVTSAAFYSYIPALKHYGQDLKIIHFIGVAKPWLQQFNWETRSVDAPEHLRQFLQLWWDLFAGQVHSQLDVAMEFGVEVEEGLLEPSPEDPPADAQHHYEPEINAESEFPWHWPQAQSQESENQAHHVNMPEVHDPWEHYRGNVPPKQDYSSQHSEHGEMPNEEEIRKYAWEYQQNTPQQECNYQQPQSHDHDHIYYHQPQSQQHHHHTHHHHSKHQQVTQTYTEHQSHHQHHHWQHHDHNHSDSYHRQPEHEAWHNHENQSHHEHSHFEQNELHQDNQFNDHSHETQHEKHKHTNYECTHSQESHSQVGYSYHRYDGGVLHQPAAQSISNDNAETHSETKFYHQNNGYKLYNPYIIQKNIGQRYYLHLDHRPPRRIRRRRTKLDPIEETCSNGFGNAHSSDSESEEEFIIPRHPYDGFYLRHRPTIDSRGHKICLHEIPPTPFHSPPAEEASSRESSPTPSEEFDTASECEDQYDSGVAGNLARVVPGTGGSQREAIDELTRRQGWEAGNIDYMGADSFDNIWAKISQTLNQQPPKQPSPPPKEPTPPKEPSPPKAEQAEEAPKQAEEPTPVPTPASAPAPEAAPVPEPSPAAVAEPTLESVKAPTPAEAAPAPATVEPEAPKAAPTEAPKAAPTEAPKKTETTVPPTPPATPKSTPETASPVTESAPEVKSLPAVVEAPKAAESACPVPASPPVAAEAPATQPPKAVTPEKAQDTSATTTASTDSPPLANTPSKEEAPAVPAPKSEERRKLEKLQLVPPESADPLPTPDSELEDAAALAHAIIASELSTSVTSPSPSTDVASPPPPPIEEKKLAVRAPEVPTPPVSLAQIGVKPSKLSTAALIESSVSEKPDASASAPAAEAPESTPATPTTPSTPTPSSDGKKKLVKKSAKKEGPSGEASAPVPPPRKKEKKPKEK